MRVVVAGAGAFGSAVAVQLARAGARVTLADPAAPAANASGVAAGMLAPAFEAAADEYLVLKAARDAWPAFADSLPADLGLQRCGAVWLDLPGAEPRMQALAAILASRGAEHQLWTARELAERAPGLSPSFAGGLFTAEDWRISPPAALASLARAAADAGAERVRRTVCDFSGGQVRFDDGETAPADALVLATGPAALALAPETSLLAPIKGHILRYADTRAPSGGPCLRTAKGYAVPAADGLRVGATMEEGVGDPVVDPRAAAPLADLAAALYPALDGATCLIEAGVRATTADGWPLVGASAAPGVWLALGARRNGWLLAPLVAQMTTAYLAGGDPGPFAGLFEARRFAVA
ncbi:MAG TPA: FAD-dependent oxidoreductase [Caulobacteraceae bacterium]|nr:FAD-dependent oxidoreductase [Caulobacteraceae bacterium]